tara:strand:- start:2286 stop:2417 length:132 start_codon:yes stop_codon:yes gene_type:complete
VEKPPLMTTKVSLEIDLASEIYTRPYYMDEVKMKKFKNKKSFL